MFGVKWGLEQRMKGGLGTGGGGLKEFDSQICRFKGGGVETQKCLGVTGTEVGVSSPAWGELWVNWGQGGHNGLR